MRALSMISTILATAALISTAGAQEVVKELPLATGQTFSVCEGEYESSCAAHQVYLYCYTVYGWAEATCKVRGTNEPAKYTIAEISKRGGNKCGYTIYEITCR